MQFFADYIPAQVVNSIVYSDTANVNLIAQDGVITTQQGGRTLTTKEVHSFVKTVVASNKTEVYRHLVINRFRLNHDDLLYLACQGGAGDMAQLIMERKVRLALIIYDNTLCCVSTSTLTM